MHGSDPTVRANPSTSNSSTKLKALLWHSLLLEDKPLRRRLGRELLVLIIVEAEMRLEDVDRFFVHILVLVVLQRFQLVEALGFVDKSGVRVRRRTVLSLQLTSLQHILDALQRDSDKSRVVASEQIAEGLDATLGDEVLDLFRGAAGGCIGDGPCSFLLDIELGGLQQMHKGRHNVLVHHRLDLLARFRHVLRTRPPGTRPLVLHVPESVLI